ncbi:MAG: flagellar hook-basal body complex protein FliE [Legionella sp.]|nr:flagellar hook-basal body complex protein FliE [Legionella sp.]
MKIEGVANLLQIQTGKSIELNSPSQTSFADWIGGKIGHTNEQLNTADAALTSLASGHAENLHQAMITMEEAKLSFTYLEQIRNRLIGAYQDLLREQI